MKYSSAEPILLFLLMIFLLGSSMSLAAVGDTLFVLNSNGLPGQGGYTIPIYLKNVTIIKGLIFTVVDLPDSLSVTSIATTVRTSDFRAERVNVGGTTKILMIPNTSSTATIAAGGGTILNLTVSVNATAPGGTQATCSLANVTIANSSNQPVTATLRDGYFWFGKKGDVIYNGVVDLFDVLRMIDIAIGRPPTPTNYERWAGDFNNDGAVDVADIGQAIDQAVATTFAVAPPNSANGTAKINLPFIESQQQGNFNLPVTLNASAPVAGVQMTLNVDAEKFEIGKPVLQGIYRDMEIATRLHDGKLNILIYNLKGKTIPAGENIMFNLPVSALVPVADDQTFEIESALVASESASALETYFGETRLSGTLIPVTFALHQNNPNPFNISTFFTYDVPSISDSRIAVKLQIFNTQGQLVRTLENRERAPGRYTVLWNGTDDSGNVVSSGVYFYKLIAGDVVLSKKLAIMK